ncbi:hypothetical protein RI129_004601 [Pyrocoelia pectoralis]|uniref:Cytochrome P450 n=1 Tax=Pyrocoelia pectoralis TaxID=417401 RepID=A0AAN7VE96_9COLE
MSFSSLGNVAQSRIGVMYILITLLLLLILLLTLWFYHYYKYERYLYWVKGPRPLPLIGNLFEYISGDILCETCRLHKKYGDIVKIQLAYFPPTVTITDPNCLEFVLRSPNLISKSNDYRFLHPWLGQGLLTATGHRWRKHRKLITPGFHFEKLQYFIETFETYSNILVEKLSNAIGKETINIYPYINLCTLDIICGAAMGTEVDAQKNANSDYVLSVKEMCRILIVRSLSIVMAFDSIFQFSKNYRKQRKALKILHECSENVIKSRREMITNNSKKNINQNTLLDLLLNSQQLTKNISDTEIREEVDTFMFAGHDTVTSAITFVLYCLARHPQVQDRVVEELDSILWSNKITYSSLQKLKYLEAVIKETLRLYPPVPVYSRHTNEDIRYGNHVIPANVNIVIFPYGVHRCPKTYPNPENFDPNRFFIENQSKHSISSYIPFSAGYRNCIGQKFAMLEMKVVVSKILQRYRLLPTIPEHKLILIAETVLKSKNGVYIRLQNRYAQ